MKILVDNHNLLGDFVIFLPTLIKLREYYPNDEIHIIVGSNTEAEICKESVAVDSIYIMNPDTFTKSQYFSIIKKLRKQRFDLGIVAMAINAKKGKIFLKLAGCKKTVGRKLKGFFKNNYIVRDSEDQNEVLHNLEIIKALGFENVSFSYPFIHVSDVYMRRAEELLQTANESLISICIGTGDFYYNHGKKFYYNCKQWSLKKYIELKNQLIDSGYSVVLLGAKKEMNFVKAQNLEEELFVDTINLINACSIMESIAILKCSTLVIGGDTGLMHCAAALDVPTVSIFGATNSLLARPYSDKNKVVLANVDCQPCIKEYGVRYKEKAGVCNNRICLENITVDMVLEAVRESIG